jgi:hypothetical protein
MKKAGVNCWKIFKPGLTDTPLKRFSYIEKEEDVLYYLPQLSDNPHYGHDLISCLNCGEIYSITRGSPEYIGPSLEKKLQKTKCIKCEKALADTAKTYPDFYLGPDKKIHRAPKKYGYEEDENMIVKEFWDLYSNNKDQKEKLGIISEIVGKVFGKPKGNN